ncbi:MULTISPECIES: hypothetical protein [Burkholderiaceae]|uniref:hypothetical protein n=1 Tax=Burkholderiaceae TaxID=119060 RepID=UPI001963A123|nr:MULTISPECIES: hypothetical protein [Burkholderiaceae]
MQISSSSSIKRLASALQVAPQIQAMRDDRCASGSPSRTHCGEEVRAKQALIGLKRQRAIDVTDINHAVLEVSAKAMQERGAAAPPRPKTIKRSKTKTALNPDISI